MTAFYMFRLWFYTFAGKPRDQQVYDHAHESPRVMTIPLMVLAVGSILAGMVWYSSFFDKNFDKWFGMTVAEVHASEDHGEAKDDHAKDEKAKDDHGKGKEVHANAYVAGQGALYLAPDNHVMHDAHYVPKWVKASPFVAMVIGFVLSWLFYIRNPELPKRLAIVGGGVICVAAGPPALVHEIDVVPWPTARRSKPSRPCSSRSRTSSAPSSSRARTSRRSSRASRWSTASS